MIRMVYASNLSFDDKNLVFELINEVKDLALENKFKYPATYENFAKHTSYFKAVLRKHTDQYWNDDITTRACELLLGLVPKKIQLNDMFEHINNYYFFTTSHKRQLYQLVRDIITNRYIITPSGTMDAEFYVENFDLVKRVLSSKWSSLKLDRFDSDLKLVYRRFAPQQPKPPVVATPPPPPPPPVPVEPVAPNAPNKKVKRRLVYDNAKESLIKRIEAFIDLMDKDSTNYHVSFEHDNKYITLNISEIVNLV